MLISYEIFSEYGERLASGRVAPRDRREHHIDDETAGRLCEVVVGQNDHIGCMFISQGHLRMFKKGLRTMLQCE